jgi:hypothetical protein
LLNSTLKIPTLPYFFCVLCSQHLYHLGLSNSSDAIEQQVLVSLASGELP